VEKPKTDLRRMANPKECDVTMDPDDIPLFHFGEDSGATDNSWWE